MALSNQGFPSYSFVMFLAFAAFGSYIWSSDPLQTARPPTQNAPAISPSSLHSIPARLWQDPFRVIYARNRKNEPLAIKPLKYTPLQENIKQSISADKNGELLVLGVMVSTEAIADAEERRRRRRYALINALSEAGYVPEDAGYIHVAQINGWEEKTQRLIMPYEWFKRDSISAGATTNTHKKVLVLWLDASHYHTTPYLHLAQLASMLAPDKNIQKKMLYAILGPASSGGLYTLFQQTYAQSSAAAGTDRIVLQGADGLSELCRLNTAGIHVLSPLATIADTYLYRELNQTEGLGKHFNILKKENNNVCLSFHRTIHSDNKLMFRLVLELSKRGVTPGANHVVLLSERDTAFGRALPESFKRAFCGNACDDDYIHNFSYLRGIDGVAPGSNVDLGLTTSKSSRTKTQAKTDADTAIRRPVGSGQFDYLRRLADEIVQLDKKLRKKDGKGVLAIGILGSDVYDKLLILRALRSRLMGVTFFTTDLDAQFLHPSEYAWTRNLLITSSFDLKLNPKLQGSTPPFRDSYQTSLFYAASLALQLSAHSGLNKTFLDRVELPTRVKPLLFEVGHNGVVPLKPLDRKRDYYAVDLFSTQPPVKNEQARLHPPVGERELLLPLLLTIAIIALVLLVLKQMLPHAGYQIRWLGAGALVLAVVAGLGIVCSVREEPFILLSGVSVWPTEIINALALMLSLYFICTSLRDLTRNYERLSDKYHLLGWAESLSDKHAAKKLNAVSCMSTAEDRKKGWMIILGIMLIISAVLVALLPKTIGYDNIPLMLFIWVMLLMFWFVLINKVTPVAGINAWAEEIRQQAEDEISIQQYWKRYGDYGALKNRFLRAFTVVLIFQAFATIVFTLFGLEPPPLRGDFTRIIDTVITVSSLLGMLFLLFYMVDATRLCIVWIRGLTNNTYDWRGAVVEEWSTKMNIPWSCGVHWLKLQMVAQRTAEVSKLIYYPFIVIILILFSRINYFDDWGFPQSLAIITGVLIAIALYSAIKLRQVAEKVRSDFIKELNRDRIIVSGNKSQPNKPSLAQIDELIESVSRLRSGAFQPFLEQPVVKASLLLLGGVGFSASQFAALL